MCLLCCQEEVSESGAKWEQTRQHFLDTHLLSCATGRGHTSALQLIMFLQLFSLKTSLLRSVDAALTISNSSK